MDERVIRIKEELKRRGFDYQTLAELSELPKSTISKVLAGITLTPRIDTLDKMEKALGITNYVETPKFTDEELHIVEMYRKVDKVWKDSVKNLLTNAQPKAEVKKADNVVRFKQDI